MIRLDCRLMRYNGCHACSTHLLPVLQAGPAKVSEAAVRAALCASARFSRWPTLGGAECLNQPVLLLAGPAKVSEAAIRGWALLLSTVPTHRMTSSSIESSLQVCLCKTSTTVASVMFVAKKQLLFSVLTVIPP